MNGGHRWVLGAWLTVIAGTTIRGVSREGGLPQPNSYLAAGVVFTLLYGLAGPAPALGGVLAAGTALGVLVAPYFKNPPAGGVLETVTGWLQKIGGAPEQQQQGQTQGPQQPAAKPAGK